MISLFRRTNPDTARTSKPEKAPLKIIKLPEDERRVKQLEVKLEQYKQRLERKQRELAGIQAVENIHHLTSGTRFKIAILERLLSEGSINVYELSREIGKEEDLKTFNAESLLDAFVRINRYVKTGIGLPEIEEK